MAKTKSRVQQKKKPRLQRKAHMIRRLKRSGKALHIVGEINDKDLMTLDILKKRRTSARANITLSGKKKRKILKQIAHNQADKQKIDVPSQKLPEIIEDVQMSLVKTKTKKKRVKSSVVEDVEMSDD